CFVCSKMGAAITCWMRGCGRSFHLPCASQGECVTQYFGLYRSFCWEHRPQQPLQAHPEQKRTCSICLETLDNERAFKIMVCPACQDAWFHRNCIQKQAFHAGISFCCPCCHNKELFVLAMLKMGIRLFRRPPSWESDGGWKQEDQLHRQCDVATCLCPGGREQVEEEGPWELLMCFSCAAEGTHRGCSCMRMTSTRWECSGC
ncbi:G2E3 ligase, partial [Mionectes macconnelli]|nr:G2E3 ligase [Mionectes macconnelli]